MLNDAVDKDKFLTGIKYGLIAETIIFVIVITIWWIGIGNPLSFPFALYTFGFGGIYFTIAGCVGPGRYQKDYKILLYTPESGSSFSDKIKVSGFVIDDQITKGKVIVNGQGVATINFDQDGMGEVTISREDFIYETINSIYIEDETSRSNVNTFTLFEYTEDMTDEEIEELVEMETKPPVKSLEEAKQSYTEKISGRIGSIAVGLGTLGLVNFLFGIVLDLLFDIKY